MTTDRSRTRSWAIRGHGAARAALEIVAEVRHQSTHRCGPAGAVRGAITVPDVGHTVGVKRGTAIRCMTTLAMAAGFVGCATDTQADPSIPPDDAIVVVGSGVCEMTPVSDEVVDGVNMIVELFVCEDTMSDPRVSGTEELLVETRLVDSTVGGTWTTREATLTNDGGTWSGTLQGIVDLQGVLPFAEGLVPYNYGEAHFVGEGAYEGLEYHYYISGSNGEAGVTGWITSSD